MNNWIAFLLGTIVGFVTGTVVLREFAIWMYKKKFGAFMKNMKNITEETEETE